MPRDFRPVLVERELEKYRLIEDYLAEQELPELPEDAAAAASAETKAVKRQAVAVADHRRSIVRHRGVEHPGSQTFAVSARHAAAGKQGELTVPFCPQEAANTTGTNKDINSFFISKNPLCTKDTVICLH